MAGRYDHEHMRSLAQQGYSAPEIAEQTGASRPHVRKICSGLLRKPEYDHEQLRQLASDGLTTAEIAEQTGTPVATVRRVCRDLIQRDRPDIDVVREAAAGMVGEFTVDALAERLPGIDRSKITTYLPRLVDQGCLQLITPRSGRRPGVYRAN